MWTYLAKIERIIDGDTVDVSIDLGFKTYTKQRLRLARIDAPEMFGVKHSSEEYESGKKAKAYLESLIPPGTMVTIKSEKTGKFGRYIAEIQVDEVNVNDHMVKKGYAEYEDY